MAGAKSLIKSILKYVSGILFIIILTLAVVGFSLYQFTTEDNLKPVARQLLSQQLSFQLNSQQTTMYLTLLKSQCQGRDSVIVPFGISNATIICSELANANATTFIGIVSDQIFSQIYNTKYDCEFMDCLSKNSTFVISSSMHSMIFTYFIYALLLSLIFGLILYATTSGASGKLKAFGISFISVGIQAILVIFIGNSLPAEIMNVAGFVIKNLFNFMFVNFLVFLFLGCITFVAGYAIGRKEVPANKGKKYI